MNGKNGISELITEYNSSKSGTVSPDTVRDIAKWITSILNIFGLNGDAAMDSQSIGWSGIDIPDTAKPYVETISRMRDELRGKARSTEGLTQKDIKAIVESIPAVVGSDDRTTGGFQQVMRDFQEEAISIRDSPNLSKEILALTDRIRNVDLWNCDVYLEDRENEPTLLRPVTRELRAARQEKEDLGRQKQLAKEEREKQAAAKAEKGRLSHLDMFRTNEYSAWNEEGLPTKDAEGVNITKSREKKLRKDQAAQKKLHDTWLASNVAKANSGSTNGSY
ncbi:cysteine--tRNA ligase [Physcia stellaris]|nr:cysteine--tRNA ligase [Physcia stellaris]